MFSTIYNSQDMEAAYMSTDRWMDKETVVLTCNGILFSPKEGGGLEMCHSMHEPEDMVLQERANHRKTNIAGVPLVGDL